MRIKKSALFVFGIMLAFSMMVGCTNSDKARQNMRIDAENNYGVMRTVTAYSSTGEKIGEWHGKIDVQYTDTSSSSSYMPRVDLVVFDGSKPVDRVIISGAIVVVDND